MDPNIAIANRRMMNAQKSAIGALANYVCNNGEDVDINDSNGTHKGSAINLSNPNGDNDSIYVYVWIDVPDYPVEDKRVNSICYDYKYETLLLHACGRNESYEDFEEIEGDNDNWYPLTDSECMVAATLYSIFEAIEQYVKN